MADVTICDYSDCTNWSWARVRLTDVDPEWAGLEFDACSPKHLQAYIKGLPKMAKSLAEEAIAAGERA